MEETGGVNWQLLAEPPLLEAHAAHVWLVPFAASPSLAAARVVLDAAERSRSERMLARRVRDAFISVRWALRHLLGCYTGCTPAAVQLRLEPSGRPFLAGDAVCFSVTHTDAFGMLAFAPGPSPLGVDAEMQPPARSFERVVRRVFRDDTAMLLLSQPPAGRAASFLAAWTQREAHVKAVSGGLFATPDVLPFAWPRPVRDVVRVREISPAAREWSVAGLCLEGALPFTAQATLVAAPSTAVVRCFTYGGPSATG